jgi:uncharacterized protein YraI
LIKVRNNFPGDCLMKHLRLTVLFAALLLPAVAQAGAGAGEVMSPVNLRQGPDTNTGVISVLKQGQKVKVLQEKNNWFMVALEKDTYGLRGWVYGDYISIVSAPEPKLARPQTNTPVEEGKSSPPDSHKEKEQNRTDGIQKDPMPLKEDKPKTEGESSPVLKAEKKAPPLRADTGNIPQTRAKSDSTLKRTIPPSRVTDPVQELTSAAHKPPRAPEDRQIVSPQETRHGLQHTKPSGKDLILHSREASSSGSDKTYEATPLRLAGIILKFSVVVFCCTALILSVKAYRIAKESSREAVDY